MMITVERQLTENEIKALEFVHREENKEIKARELKEKLENFLKEIKENGCSLEIMTPNACYWREIDDVIDKTDSPRYGHCSLSIRTPKGTFEL